MSVDTLQLFAEYLTSQQWQRAQVFAGTTMVATRGPWRLHADKREEGIRVSLYTSQRGHSVLTYDILHNGAHDLVYWALDKDPVKALATVTAQVCSALDHLRKSCLSEIDHFESYLAETPPVVNPTLKV